MLRDILNSDGEVVGKLELPDDTPDAVWSEKLEVYSMTPEEVQKTTPEEYIEDTSDFLHDLLTQMSAENLVLNEAGKLSNDALTRLGSLMSPMAIYILAGAAEIVLGYLMQTDEIQSIIGKDRFLNITSNIQTQIKKKELYRGGK